MFFSAFSCFFHLPFTPAILFGHEFVSRLGRSFFTVDRLAFCPVRLAFRPDSPLSVPDRLAYPPDRWIFPLDRSSFRADRSSFPPDSPPSIANRPSSRPDRSPSHPDTSTTHPQHLCQPFSPFPSPIQPLSPPCLPLSPSNPQPPTHPPTNPPSPPQTRFGQITRKYRNIGTTPTPTTGGTPTIGDNDDEDDFAAASSAVDAPTPTPASRTKGGRVTKTTTAAKGKGKATAATPRKRAATTTTAVKKRSKGNVGVTALAPLAKEESEEEVKREEVRFFLSSVFFFFFFGTEGKGVARALFNADDEIFTHTDCCHQEGGERGGRGCGKSLLYSSFWDGEVQSLTCTACSHHHDRRRWPQPCLGKRSWSCLDLDLRDGSGLDFCRLLLLHVFWGLKFPFFFFWLGSFTRLLATALFWGWIKRPRMMGCLGASSDGAKGFVWRVWAGQGGVGEEVIALFFSWG